MTVWPAPVIRMFMGQMTPAAVLAAADDPDPNKKRGQVCEANFYGGERALRTGRRRGDPPVPARRERLPQTLRRIDAAIAELKALGRRLDGIARRLTARGR